MPYPTTERRGKHRARQQHNTNQAPPSVYLANIRNFAWDSCISTFSHFSPSRRSRSRLANPRQEHLHLKPTSGLRGFEILWASLGRLVEIWHLVVIHTPSIAVTLHHRIRNLMARADARPSMPSVSAAMRSLTPPGAPSSIVFNRHPPAAIFASATIPSGPVGILLATPVVAPRTVPPGTAIHPWLSLVFGPLVALARVFGCVVVSPSRQAAFHSRPTVVSASAGTSIRHCVVVSPGRAAPASATPATATVPSWAPIVPVVSCPETILAPVALTMPALAPARPPLPIDTPPAPLLVVPPMALFPPLLGRLGLNALLGRQPRIGDRRKIRVGACSRPRRQAQRKVPRLLFCLPHPL